MESTNVKVIVGDKDIKALDKELSHIDEVERKTLILSLIKYGKGSCEMYENELLLYNEDYEGAKLLVIMKSHYYMAKMLYTDEIFISYEGLKSRILENKKREEEKQKIADLDRQIGMLITEQYL